jgi:hypothetical protein
MRHTSHVTPHTSHVTRHTSHVTRHTSHVTRHTSHVTRHTSHVTRHTSHLTRHTSHVTRHTSHVTRHTSHVTRHTSHSTCSVDGEAMQRILRLLRISAAHKVHKPHVPLQRALLVRLRLIQHRERRATKPNFGTDKYARHLHYLDGRHGPERHEHARQLAVVHVHGQVGHVSACASELLLRVCLNRKLGSFASELVLVAHRLEHAMLPGSCFSKAAAAAAPPDACVSHPPRPASPPPVMDAAACHVT